VLNKFKSLHLPVEEAWAKKLIGCMVLLKTITGMTDIEFAKRLSEIGIMERPLLGMHEQPVLLARGSVVDDQYSNTGCLARQGLYLLSGLSWANEQLEEVRRVVGEELNGRQ
jgi:hypothetical protein